jgi:hypothetical protein
MVVDRLSAWMERGLPIEIDFRPHLDFNLSVYRPWGVIESSIADAVTDHLIQYTRSYMSTVDAAITASAA